MSIIQPVLDLDFDEEEYKLLLYAIQTYCGVCIVSYINNDMISECYYAKDDTIWYHKDLKNKIESQTRSQITMYFLNDRSYKKFNVWMIIIDFELKKYSKKWYRVRELPEHYNIPDKSILHQKA